MTKRANQQNGIIVEKKRLLKGERRFKVLTEWKRKLLDFTSFESIELDTIM